MFSDEQDNAKKKSKPENSEVPKKNQENVAIKKGISCQHIHNSIHIFFILYIDFVFLRGVYEPCIQFKPFFHLSKLIVSQKKQMKEASDLMGADILRATIANQGIIINFNSFNCT